MTPEALASIHALCFDGAAPRPWKAGEFAALLAAEGTILVKAPGDGFALGRVAADEAELLTLAVRPEARRKGIARGLLAAFEGAASSRGAVRGYLEVAEGNAAARALYSSACWTTAGFRRDYYAGAGAKRSQALVMVKALVPEAGGSD